MPYFANSPEAGMGRTDSKNPATTCKGMTTLGRPCRRALGASPGNSPNGKGVLAVLSHAAGLNADPAAFYCWQHKDQAPAGSTIARPDRFELNGRTSIDTLMGRLGVVDVQDDTPTKPKEKRQTPQTAEPLKKSNLPQEWQEVPGPFLTVPTGQLQSGKYSSNDRPATHTVRPRKSEYHFSFFCCGPKPQDRLPPPKPRVSRPPMTQVSEVSTPIPNKLRSSYHRPSETALLKSWIPDRVSPSTHSALMTELAKPLSQQDKDTGYIYMFWETPLDAPHPTNDLARSLMHDVHDAWEARNNLLVDPWSTAVKFGHGVMSTSEAIRAAGKGTSHINTVKSDKQGPSARPGTMMLKIGRADNVQKRMDQWTRQCGRNITLLRYYPYKSTKQTPKKSPAPQTARSSKQRSNDAGSKHPGPVPNCARVERLIHVELADQRVMKQCDTCGRQHREWFEVDASREGVQRVDETIRRWVNWGEDKGL